MQVIIDIPEDVLKRTVFYREFKNLNDCVTTIKALEKAIPLNDVRAEISNIDTYERDGYWVMSDVWKVLNNIGKEGKE